MTLHTHNPFGPWRELAAALALPEMERPWRPSFDVQETESAYVLRGDLPGMTQEDIEVRTEDGVLAVRGERSDGDSDKTAWMRRERPNGKFARSYRLPEDADESDVSATYVNGVLEVRVPKRELVDSSRIVPIN